MAPKGGRDGAPLSRTLKAEAYRFEFFQAVRLLERMAAEEPAGGEKRRPVGYDYAPRHEAVRFRAVPAQSFPTGSIAQVRAPRRRGEDEEDRPPTEMLVAFMGLTGPQGVLPQHYTSLLIRRVREKDFALCDFLDLFNHRTISLFYRAWEKYRFPFAYERSQLAGEKEDLFTHCLYCLLGLGTGGLRGRMRVDDETFLYHAGHFAHFPRNALSLEAMLADYFELPVRVIQFLGQWLYLDPEDQSAMPGPRFHQGLNNQLGASLVVGERVWDVEGKFRVRIGPLGYRDFRRFVPSGDALQPLCQLVRTYAGPQFEFDVQPVLRAEEVPWCRLGGDPEEPSCLGWNTWVRTGDFEKDVDDAVFSMDGAPNALN